MNSIELEIEEARRLHAELKSIFSKPTGGYADPEMLQRIKALCWSANRALANGYCREKIGSVEDYAADLFSARKHESWARGSMSGPEFLRLQALKALDSFAKMVGQVEAIHKAGGPEAYLKSLESPPPAKG